jgi:hypothetical protein
MEVSSLRGTRICLISDNIPCHGRYTTTGRLAVAAAVSEAATLLPLPPPPLLLLLLL